MGGVVKGVGSLFGYQEGSTGGLGASSEAAFAQAQKEKQMLALQDGNRNKFADQLYNQASGGAPSLAEAQMKSAQDRSIAQQIAMAKSNRSANAGLQARNLQNNAALQSQQTVQAAGQARLQEQMANQGQYSNYITGQQQNLNSLMGLNQQSQAQLYGANAANARGQNQFMGDMVGTAGQIGAMVMMSDKNEKKKIKYEGRKPLKMAEGGEVPGKKELSKEEKEALNPFSGKAEQKRPVEDLNAILGGHLFEQALSAAPADNSKMSSGVNAMTKQLMAPSSASMPAAFGSASRGAVAIPFAMGGQIPGKAKVKGDSEQNDFVDAKLSPGEVVVPRTVVAKGKEAAAEFVQQATSAKSEDMSPKSFLDALKPFSYEYKNPSKPGAGNGKFLSVMAQDLEKAGPVGKSMVSQQPDGSKMVDYGKGFGAILAAQAHLNERLSEIESRKKKKV